MPECREGIPGGAIQEARSANRETLRSDLIQAMAHLAVLQWERGVRSVAITIERDGAVEISYLLEAGGTNVLYARLDSTRPKTPSGRSEPMPNLGTRSPMVR
jgi:hypothetical protein